MARIRRPGRPYVIPIASDGTVSENEVGRGSFSLVAGATYFYPLGGIDALLQHAQIQWDANAILTITFEDCDMGEDEVGDHSTIAGDWVPHNASTGAPYVESTAGGVVTNKTVAVAGGTAGAATYQVADSGARRNRLKVVVSANGTGVVRVGMNDKD